MMMVPTDPDEPLVDSALVDSVLADEIALLGDVIAAAAAASGPALSEAEIDAALGLTHPEPDASDTAQGA